MPISSSHFPLSATDRLDEIASILAAGLIRLHRRKSSPLSADAGESWLDFSPDQRGHAPANDTLEDAL
jgi:hypothetical protein